MAYQRQIKHQEKTMPRKTALNATLSVIVGLISGCEEAL